MPAADVDPKPSRVGPGLRVQILLALGGVILVAYVPLFFAIAQVTRATSLAGRESQSMAFLNTPGIELLYSGVTSSTPSAAAIRSLSVRTASGRPLSASRSPS